MLFLPRRWRIVCFFIVTAWQIPVILTANYTFLNYLVLVLGFLLLDDRFLLRVMPQRWRQFVSHTAETPAAQAAENVEALETSDAKERIRAEISVTSSRRPVHSFRAFKLALTSVMLIWIFYATTVQMIWIVLPRLPLPTSPVAALDPFRIANRYGLFAVMTRGRYEIEFQGSNDGQTWVAYPFRYKPQDPSKRPGIYAPYQPRFEWNLWFASLGSWRDNLIVPSTEERLLGRRAGCARAVRRKSLSGWAAETGARRVVAVLVYHSGRETRDRHVVEPGADRDFTLRCWSACLTERPAWCNGRNRCRRTSNPASRVDGRAKRL